MRKITSLILALAFIMVAVTGVQLDLSHSGGNESAPVHMNSNGAAASHSHAGSVAHEFHQPSFYPKVVHEWSGYLFIIAGCVHLILNLKAMQSYFRIKKVT